MMPSLSFTLRYSGDLTLIVSGITIDQSLALFCCYCHLTMSPIFGMVDDTQYFRYLQGEIN